MNEVVFKPKYSPFMQLANLFGLIVGIITILTSFNSLWYEVVGWALCIMGLFGFYMFPREILFQKDLVTVKYWLFPGQTFKYSELKLVDGKILTLGKSQRVSLLNMRNAEEFVKIFRSFASDEIFSSSQVLEDPGLKSQRVKMQRIIYLLIGLALLFGFVQGIFGTSINLFWPVAGIALILIVFLIINSRRKPE
jgi:uncharacterized membrane protein YobD (UPF0266 family)